jgi:hypothetical protein
MLMAIHTNITEKKIEESIDIEELYNKLTRNRNK